MTGKVSPTLKVLTEMRDGIRTLNKDVGELKENVGHLEHRMDNFEATVARELTKVTIVLYDVRDLLATRLDQRTQVNDHEVRIRALEDQARRAG